MRLLVNVLVVATALALAAGCGSSYVSAPQTSADTLNCAGLSYYWQADIRASVPMAADERVTQLFKLADLDRDKNVYALTNMGRLICYDARLGTYQWDRHIGDARHEVFRPVLVDKIQMSKTPPQTAGIMDVSKVTYLPDFAAVVVNTESRVMVLRHDTGEVVRDIRLDFPAATAGCTDGRRYYVASTNGTCWVVRLHEAVQQPAFSPDVAVEAAVQCYDQHFFVAASNGQFYSRKITPAFSDPEWKRELSGPVRPKLHGGPMFTVDFRGLFVPANDGRIYGMSPITGENLWPPFPCRGVLNTPIQVGKDSLFQHAQGDALYALDIAKGTQRWSNPDGQKVVAVMGDDVAFIGRGNVLMLADQAVGTVRQSVPLKGLEVFAANAVNDSVWAASGSGRLVCIRKTSAGYLRPETIAQALSSAPASGAAPASGPTSAP